MRPREAFIAVTYSCNAKCSFCNIWKRTDVAEIDSSHYAKLPKTIRTVNITGGEPFLRSDIVDLVKVIHERIPFSRIVFSSNGLLTDVIVGRLVEIRKFHRKVGLGVSIDGLSETHDKLRGVPGIFDQAVKTVRAAKAAGITDLRIAMTLSPQNVHEVKQVFDLSRELGVEFSTTYVHNSEIYFGKTTNVAPRFDESSSIELEQVIQSLLHSRSIKDWFRAYHAEGILDANVRREFRGMCSAGSRYFFMSPNGDVFPCNVMDSLIGNITEVASFDELLADSKMRKVTSAVHNCTNDCWMVCNTRSLIIAHPLKASRWILRAKLLPRRQFDH